MAINQAAYVARMAALRRSRKRAVIGSLIGAIAGSCIGIAAYIALRPPDWYSTFDSPRLYWPVAVVTKHGWQRAYIDEAGMYRSFEDGSVINGVVQWRYVLKP